VLSKSLVGTVKHVWSMDPALDRSDPEKFDPCWDAFLKSGNPDDLAPVILDGMQPAVFTLARLSRRAWLMVSAADGPKASDEAVACSLRDLSGFSCDGEAVRLEFVTDAVGLKRVKASILDRIYDPLLFAELGMRVLQVSRLDPLSVSG
jgi:hypothetical protein